MPTLEKVGFLFFIPINVGIYCSDFILTLYMTVYIVHKSVIRCK